MSANEASWYRYDDDSECPIVLQGANHAACCIAVSELADLACVHVIRATQDPADPFAPGVPPSTAVSRDRSLRTLSSSFTVKVVWPPTPFPLMSSISVRS